MRLLFVSLGLGLGLLASCGKGKGSGPAAAGSGSASAPAATPAVTPAAAPLVPPGLPATAELPPASDGYRTLPPQRFRHSSVRGDFRIYRTASGIVVSWKTLLSARSLDGKPMWKKEDQGRAVAVSADGTRIVTNNNAGELLVLDAKTGAPVGPATQLGGRGDPKRSGVWVSAFAWSPDGKHILALDSTHAYLLGGDGAVQRELPIKCKESCFFTAAVALSNDDALVVNSPGTGSSELLKIKLADGAAVASADYMGHDLDLAADHTRFVTDSMNELAVFDAALQPKWTAPLPGLRGVKLTGASEGSSIEWKPVPKLSPDGKYIVVNDAAGALWLVDAKDGKPVFAYPSTLIQFVEDVMWLDAGTLIAIDNPGHVTRISGTPARVVWSELDGPEGGEWDGP